MMFSGNPGRFAVFCLMLILGSGLFAQNYRAVLVRGNGWVTENPGFGDRAIAALLGEYRIETLPASDGEQPTFFVRVSTDTQLLRGAGWQPRPGIASAVQRRVGSDLFIGFPYNGGAELGSWAILFHFPAENDNALPDNDFINKLTGAWTNRFRYFFSLIRIPSDMSLPAIINF